MRGHKRSHKRKTEAEFSVDNLLGKHEKNILGSSICSRFKSIAAPNKNRFDR